VRKIHRKHRRIFQALKLNQLVIHLSTRLLQQLYNCFNLLLLLTMHLLKFLNISMLYSRLQTIKIFVKVWFDGSNHRARFKFGSQTGLYTSLTQALGSNFGSISCKKKIFLLYIDFSKIKFSILRSIFRSLIKSL